MRGVQKPRREELLTQIDIMRAERKLLLAQNEELDYKLTVSKARNEQLVANVDTMLVQAKSLRDAAKTVFDESTVLRNDLRKYAFSKALNGNLEERLKEAQAIYEWLTLGRMPTNTEAKPDLPGYI